MNLLETEYKKYLDKESSKLDSENLTLDEWCDETLISLNFYLENEGKFNGYFTLEPAPEEVRNHRKELYEEILKYKNTR
jgi:hypothetical protein